MKDQLTIKSGIILKDLKIVIPKELQKRVLKIAHEGHQGMTKTKLHVRGKVWWPGIDLDVEQEVKSCIPCLSMSPESPPEPLKPSPMPAPWHTVHIDIYGPLPSGESILGIIDACSRWPELHVIKSTTSRTITNKLNKTFSAQGYPEKIVTDNAPNLTSIDVTDFCSIYGIQHRKVCPYWPQANAEIERFYRTLGKNIKTVTAEGKNWRSELSTFLF